MNIHDLSRGVFDLTARRQQPAPPPPPAPVFTKQPGGNATTGTAGGVTTTAVLFQAGDTLTIDAGTATGATSWQWQKQQADQSWADVQNGGTAKLTIPAAPAAADGVYRVLAVNAGGSTASSPVTAINSFIYLQNIQGVSDPGQPTRDPNNMSKWTLNNAPVGGKESTITFIRRQSTPQDNLMGVTGGLSVATVDPNVVAIVNTPSAPRQFDMTFVSPGTTEVNIRIAALDAKLVVTVVNP